MKISVGISNRHVHLCEEDYKLLFCEEVLGKKKDLKQPMQFATDKTVTISGPKGQIENVRILGPLRNYTQVEVSKTDSYKLGINPPIRTSGDLLDASLITIIGPYGIISKNACIIANRHVHVNDRIIKEYGLEGVKVGTLKITGEKGGILENVYLKKTEEAFFEVHLDTDDANAFLLKQDDSIEFIPSK